MDCTTGSNDFPKGVIAYSTRGGISGKFLRSSTPDFSKDRSCLLNICRFIPSTAVRSFVNRLVPLEILNKIIGFHLLSNIFMHTVTPHLDSGVVSFAAICYFSFKSVVGM